MKISINILPDSQKKKMKEEEKIGFAMKIIFSIAVVLMMTNIVFVSMQIVLSIEYQAAKRSGESFARDDSGKERQLEKIFKDTNSKVSNLFKISQNMPAWSRVFIRISEIMPPGIRISQLSFDGSVLKISGFSENRDNFLDFQNRLKDEGFLFPIDISNLVDSNNFNFDLNITIPQSYLLRK